MADHPSESDSSRLGGRRVTTSTGEQASSQVAQLEPFQTQALAGGSDGEPADTLADAGESIADVLDVRQGRNAVGVVGPRDFDGFDREASPGRPHGDCRVLAARALSRLPADRRHMSTEADHLALQLGDPDRLDAKALTSSSRC